MNKPKINIIIFPLTFFKSFKSLNIGITLNSKNYPIFCTNDVVLSYTRRKNNKIKKTPGRSGKFGSHVKT